MLTREKNYYAVLEVEPSAEVGTVEDAYWRLAWSVQATARSDPSASKRLELLNEAYSVLGAPALRAEYDRASPGPPPEPPTEQEPRASILTLPLLVAGQAVGLLRRLCRLSLVRASAKSSAPASPGSPRARLVPGTSLRMAHARRAAIDPSDIRACAATTDVASPRLGSPPAYSEAEVKRLLLACDNRTPEGLRNRALVLVLFDTGVRRGELISMNLPNWKRRQVRVCGRSGIRDIPLGMTALQALERYVRCWDISDPPVWRGKRGPLTGSGVLQIVRRLCRQAAVAPKGVRAFRRAAAAQMKRLGMNDSDILEVFGWRDISMLRRYTAEVAQELAHAAHTRHSPGDALRAP